MEERGGAFTLRIVLPNELLLEKLLGSLEVAVMVVVPAATAVTTPLLLTVATDGLEEVQVTCADISMLVPSEYEPVAANCWVLPAGTLGLSGVTTIQDRVAAVTVRAVFPG